jgi:glycosyltransferase involved in cell wall biosynthesis
MTAGADAAALPDAHRSSGYQADADMLRDARTDPAYWSVFAAARPLVSVCVPTSNRARLLTERCVPSLLRQTYANLEIVIVGDGCTDDTADRLARFGDNRIRFHNRPVRGPYPPPGWWRWLVAGTHAMNHALGLATGDFVTHLDDDDQAFEDRIATLVEAACAHRAELVWHPFLAQDARGTWSRLGDGSYSLGQMTTGSIFYHRFFARFGWNVRAYQVGEPGDWNRLKRFQDMGIRAHFVDRPLLFHFKEQSQGLFTLLPGEVLLDAGAGVPDGGLS